MTGDVSQDPSDYYLTEHASIRSKERGIKRELIATVIDDGVHQPAKGGWPHVRFLHHPIGVEDCIAVVVDAEKHAVQTVFWNLGEYDHPKLESPEVSS
jgi:hypothetical protein